MKTKFSRILVAVLILTLMLSVLAACGTDEVSLDGMCIVTFNFNGGGLRIIGRVDGEIYHAYEPGSLLIDISKYPGYELTKNGYVFVGWNTAKDGSGDEWDFDNDRVKGNMTLYAQWEKEIVYRYVIYLVGDEGKLTEIDSYRVKEGDPFDGKHGKNLSSHNRTFLGYYSDPDLQEGHEWDENFKHPGGGENYDVPVYVKSTEGVWTFVSTYEELVKATGNIYLLNDIDCEGRELYFGDFNKTLYGGGGRGFENQQLAEGERYTISNFTVPNKGTSRRPYYTIFNKLGNEARIEKVNFTGAKFEITVASSTTDLIVSALAQSVDKPVVKKEPDGKDIEQKCVISDVTITGTYQVNLPDSINADRLAKVQEDIAKINSVSYEGIENIDWSNLTITITEITKQD